MPLQLRPKEKPPAHNRALAQLFDVRQLAARWNVSERTVRRLMEREAFAITRIGRRVLVSEAQIALFEAKNTQGIQCHAMSSPEIARACRYESLKVNI